MPADGPRVDRVATPALLLGAGGLVPFVGLAALTAFGPVSWYAYWLAALSFYGAVILSFVGALHWGYAVSSGARGANAWLQYGFSVAPALAAWLSLLLPVWTGLQVQAGGLALVYAFDRGMARGGALPSGFLRLRAALTAIGAASLVFASLV